MMRCKFSHLPAKSGIKHSNFVSGLISLIALIVSAQIIEPPSFRSSLSTDVITQCFTPINLTELATRFGSSQSAGFGLPVATAQKPQERVQIFPNIINVAVPAPQH